MNSPYLYPWIKDKWYRRIIRWAYARFLDELYIPKGTTARIVQDDNRKPAREGLTTIQLSATSPSRKGQQDYTFHEQFGFKSAGSHT